MFLLSRATSWQPWGSLPIFRSFASPMAELAVAAEPSLWLPLQSQCIVTVTQHEWESADAKVMKEP